MASIDPLAPARAALMRRDAATAVRMAEPHCAATDPRRRSAALSLCGEAMFQLGHPANAVQLLRAAVQLDPGRVEGWAALGRVLVRCGQRREAIQIWKEAALRVPSDPRPWLHLAECLREEGDPAGAAAAIRSARARAPERADLVRQEVEALRDANSPAEARRVAREALLQFPADTELHLLVANGCSEVGDWEQCLFHLDGAVAADPKRLSARVRRASHYLRTRQLEKAAEDLAAAVSIAPSHPEVLLLQARLADTRGARDQALATLDRLLSDPTRLLHSIHARARALRAELHAKQGNHTREWSDLVAGQQAWAREALGRGEDGSAYLKLVESQHARLRPDSRCWPQLSALPRHPPAGAPLIDRPPVFMFGFPRSGTTLAERVLGAHPHLTATDECNLLGAVCAAMIDELHSPAPEALSDAQVVYLRQVFVRRAIDAGFDPHGTRLIDKNPLNFVFVDVVRRVFPDAPILMMLRDPRDCCWSAFRQTFAPNASLILTRDLHGTATLYRAVMDLWQQARELTGLRVTEVHYEHLVSRFEDTARAMVEATGEAWDPAVLDFHRSLVHRYVRTPSFAAVGQRINRGGIARWAPHREKMDAILPILGPWVDALGVERVAPELVQEPARGGVHPPPATPDGACT